MQHSLVIRNHVDHIYIKYGVDLYLNSLDRYFTNILKETDAEHAAWLFKRYKYHMHLLIENAYILMARGSVENQQKITQLIDVVYFMYTQVYEHTLALTRKWIS